MGRWLALAALLLLTGCAGPPAPGRAQDEPGAAKRWPRDGHPWSMTGPAPTAGAIEAALDGVHAYGQDDCPFRLATCDDSNEGQAGTAFRVSEVACEPLTELQDRCTFALEELVAGRGRARSRCSGWFGVYGTSHDPLRWEVERDEQDEARLDCRCRQGTVTR